jgi:hypothetical protein
MAYVYQHTRLDKNEPFYIGIGTSEYYNRARRKKGRNKIWHRIVDKTPYEIKIIYDNLSWEEACQREKELIAKYGRLNNKTGILANLTDGGEGNVGAVLSPDHRKAVAEANRRRVFTPEQRAAMGERARERMKNPEYKKKMTEALVKSLSTEKFKQAAKAAAQKRRGLKMSEEARVNISKAARKRAKYKIVQKSLSGEVIKIWDNLVDIENELKFDGSNVGIVCKGKGKTSHGFIWEYLK